MQVKTLSLSARIVLVVAILIASVGCDQATKRIVRSVPPEDLQKLNSGDLVHLLV